MYTNFLLSFFVCSRLELQVLLFSCLQIGYVNFLNTIINRNITIADEIYVYVSLGYSVNNETKTPRSTQ